MNRNYISVLLVLQFFLLFPAVCLAGTPPAAVAAAFKSRYPQATGTAWSEEDGYCCANFADQGFDTRAWFDMQGKWVMTQTDFISADRLPPAVYNAFAAGSYSNGVVDNVTRVVFPRWEPIWVIQIGKDNVDIQYQLFYEPDGTLLKSRNVTYLHNLLGPSTFLENERECTATPL